MQALKKCGLKRKNCLLNVEDMYNKNQEKSMTKWARCLAGIVLLAFTVMCQGTASAGLLDKLNAATKKLNDYNARQQSGQSGQAAAEAADEDPDLTVLCI
jgi:hypothetical protein